MGHFAAMVGVIFLLGLINLSAANRDTCDLYAAVGLSVTLPLDFDGLTNAHELKWFHNNTVVFHRKQNKLIVVKTGDISPMGSLQLKNLQFSDAGTYQADVLHPNNSIAKKWSGRLCVQGKVPKPQLTYICDFEFCTVNLNCIVTSPEGLVFSWTLGKKTLLNQTRQTWSISLSHLKGENVMCSVGNKVNRENSDVVRLTCKSPTWANLHCFTFKTMAAVLAGAGGLILLLLIIIIILCCHHKRAKTQMRLTNKVQLRMPSLNKQESGSISPDYETMHGTEDYLSPSPKPSPRACYKNDSQLEGQSVQLSAAAEELKPSPVPKPRTKITQTTNM
ncbi:SLAM family member 6 [Anabas testudineus]|uniref:SLAM family member 6 n=1 Tax=Anabas testudineus TaxID=64144 RepID=UPI000E462B75|nr:SLAM family member 6 [Anabas testudineus]